MTHVIIPIAKIVSEIDDLTNEHQELMEYPRNLRNKGYDELVVRVQTLLDIYPEIVKTYKKIALTEDAIEARVKEATDTHNLNGWEQQGYRQALKDLI